MRKKEKIIESGLKLFRQQGFYNTTTTDIAKDAGVSVGIVYGYFQDKKDILMQALHLYFRRLNAPIDELLQRLDENYDMKKFADEFIELSVQSHLKNRSAHEEMVAMSHLDEDVRDYFLKEEQARVETLVEKLSVWKKVRVHAYEKVHIAWNLVENLCHECIYHQHAIIDSQAMAEETKLILKHLFGGESNE